MLVDGQHLWGPLGCGSRQLAKVNLCPVIKLDGKSYREATRIECTIALQFLCYVG